MLVPVLAVAVAVAVGDTAVVVEITVVVAASVEDVGGGVVTAVDIVVGVVVESGATQGRQSATSWLAWSPGPDTQQVQVSSVSQVARR